MKNEKDIQSQTYALYTFIDMETDAKCGATQNTYSKSYPNLYTKLKTLNHLISYAIKRYFNIDIQEEKPFKYVKYGKGFIDGIYFSISSCLRIMCVCVSKNPIGINVQSYFPISDELEYAKHNFCEKEFKEYEKRKYGDETYYYMICQKHAYQIKNNLVNEDLKEVDSTQETYTFYRETFFDIPFYFAATDNVEFESVDIKEILP